MNGMTLALISIDGTPGYPAPEIACMVVVITCVMPNGLRGAKPITKETVAQFGLVTICPFHGRWRCCKGTSFR